MTYNLQKIAEIPNPQGNGLDNIAYNIYKKMFELKVTLPEIARMIGIEYQTLRRITEQKNNYNPNFKALCLIADFFNVTVSDLLGSPNVGQYVPLLEYKDAENYLDSKNDFDISKFQRIFCDRYIHQNSFACEINCEYFGSKLLLKYIFKPYDKIGLGNHLLLRNKDRHYLGIVESINDSKLNLLTIGDAKSKEFNISQTKIIALAVKQILNDDLT
jgi:transcriptional regulator with XRE-family HTH domain